MAESLRLLAPYGRFLELGKTDIYLNRSLGLEPFQNNLSYFAIDMDRLFRQRPDTIRQLLDEISHHLQSGAYPSLVCTEFSAPDVAAAFRHMSQRKNIGKVVVSMARGVDAASPTATVRPDATYLVTGGLGGLGLRLAGWLVDRGAKSLALVSRGEPSLSAQQEIAELAQRGVRIECLQADVSCGDDVARVVQQIASEMPPLRGVFHLAGVLDDGVILRMSPERWERVLAPKAGGAWQLHQATRDLPLDWFVCFSSAASLLGSAGQANYAAANAFLDALAHYRRRCGLPALTINWGAWASEGMTESAGRRDEIAYRGFALLDAKQAFAALEALLRRREPQAAVMSVDWPIALKPFRQRVPPMVRHFAAADDTSTAVDAIDADLIAELEAAPPAERVALLTEHFRQRLAKVAGFAPHEIDVHQTLNALGFDSLMLFELKNAIETQMQITIPTARLFENPSLTQLAEWSLELHAESHQAVR
jgi:myxalamid-type polyketide synthase MxaB